MCIYFDFCYLLQYEIQVPNSETKFCLKINLFDRKLVKAPSNFIAGRPKAALLFWFFGGFRCGVLLLIVILVIYLYQNR